MKNVSNYKYNNVSLLFSNEQVSIIRAISGSIVDYGNISKHEYVLTCNCTMSEMTQYDTRTTINNQHMDKTEMTKDLIMTTKQI